MSNIEFQDFPKMARLSRDMIVTEKLDGTNAQVCIGEDGALMAGSRTRWITPENDNYGFAAWVQANRDELLTLGPGRHFGEWWGAGIQRGYGLKEKRFSLFNATRWAAHDQPLMPIPSLDPRAPVKWQQRPPACCDVVPVLIQGPFRTDSIDACIQLLRERGSYAAPGFMRPEGVVVLHMAGNVRFKKTLEKDEVPKALPDPRRCP
jgi:hypothetical protein